jgi:mercuric reductase
MDEYDVVVIGTGGAAMAAGIEVRSRGGSVLLVEHGPLGGTCLNIGCVPSKTLLAAAAGRHRALSNPFPMVPTSAGSVDLPALIAQKQDLVEHLREEKYADVADAHGFAVRYGHAAFVDERTLHVDGEPVSASAFVIATGAAPHVPDLPGVDGVDVLTSTTAMEQQTLPASMVVLGGGYVGLEQAQLSRRCASPPGCTAATSPRAAAPDPRKPAGPACRERAERQVEWEKVSRAGTPQPSRSPRCLSELAVSSGGVK